MLCAYALDFFNDSLTSSLYNYLEIGVFNGDGIASLATNHSNKTIYAIDPFIEDGHTTHITEVEEGQPLSQQKHNTYNNIQGINNITLYEMTSNEFYQQLTQQMIETMNIGWILIDGSHHYEDVVVDIKLAMALIGNRSGGIFFDDTYKDDVKRAHDEFTTTYTSYIKSTIEPCNGQFLHHINDR